MTTFTAETTLTTINCKCGGVYAIQERYRQSKHETGGSWNCPYCQTGWGYGESENNRLRKQVEQANNAAARERARHDQTRAELQTTESRRRAEKAAKTRIKNRIKNGVCPCCNRTFQDLHRHMKNQHPDFTSES